MRGNGFRVLRLRMREIWRLLFRYLKFATPDSPGRTCQIFPNNTSKWSTACSVHLPANGHRCKSASIRGPIRESWRESPDCCTQARHIRLTTLYDRWTATAHGGTCGQGTPIALTYSFFPDGVSIPGGGGEPTANNVLNATMDSLFGSPAVWKAKFAQCFSRWSAVSGVTYQEVSDDAAAFPGSSGVFSGRGDVCTGGSVLSISAQSLTRHLTMQTRVALQIKCVSSLRSRSGPTKEESMRVFVELGQIAMMRTAQVLMSAYSLPTSGNSTSQDPTDRQVEQKSCPPAVPCWAHRSSF